MPIRVIDAVQDSTAAAELRALREQLSPRGDVVSEAGRQRTIAAFGQPLAPREVVALILREVRARGFAALQEFTRTLDGFELSQDNLRVSEAELHAAHRAARPEYLAALRTAAANVRRFQEAIRHRDVTLPGPHETLGLRYLPVRRVGVCVPGGAAAYPSTVLMAVLPAQVAGVEEIAVMAPPTAFGANNPDLLAACHELGVREVYRMGAQGVGAFAFGVEGVPAADMIVGPGNLFVALAKQQVAGEVGIDMLAGPTEVVVLADGSANPEHVAADLISQAEHAPGASILITWERSLVAPVQAALERQLGEVDRGGQARESLAAYGAIAVVADEAAGLCVLSDALAPEHLQLATRVPQATLQRIRNAGAVFVGHWTPVAVGDYLAGPSHTLPTGGAARFASPLSCNTFLKASSVIEYARDRLAEIADPLRTIAAVEGLTAHSRSVDIRLPR